MTKLYYSYDETAEILGIKKTTLYSYIWQGKLQPVKRPGLQSVFKRNYINKIAKEGIPLATLTKSKTREI